MNKTIKVASFSLLLCVSFMHGMEDPGFQSGRTLKEAASSRRKLTPKEIEKAKAQIRAHDEYEVSDITVPNVCNAIKDGDIEAFQNLLNQGMSASAILFTNEKYTLFHHAALHGQAKILQLLIDRTPENELIILNMRNSSNKTALDIATEENHDSCVEVLNNVLQTINTPGKTEIEPVIVNVHPGDNHSVSYDLSICSLVAMQRKLNERQHQVPESLEEQLQNAVCRNNLEEATALLQQGVQTTAWNQTVNGNALHIAAQNGNSVLLLLLINSTPTNELPRLLNMKLFQVNTPLDIINEILRDGDNSDEKREELNRCRKLLETTMQSAASTTVTEPSLQSNTEGDSSKLESESSSSSNSQPPAISSASSEKSESNPDSDHPVASDLPIIDAVSSDNHVTPPSPVTTDNPCDSSHNTATFSSILTPKRLVFSVVGITSLWFVANKAWKWWHNEQEQNSDDDDTTEGNSGSQNPNVHRQE